MAGQADPKQHARGNKRDAEQIEAAERTRLAKGEVGIKQKPRGPTLAEFAPKFTRPSRPFAPRRWRR